MPSPFEQAVREATQVRDANVSSRNKQQSRARNKEERRRERLTVKHRDDLTQGAGYLHGGVISALCDSSVAFALATMIDGGEDMLTIELKVNFIAPADDNIFADARIIHKGRKTAVGEVEVRMADNTFIAKALVTYYLNKD